MEPEVRAVFQAKENDNLYVIWAYDPEARVYGSTAEHSEEPYEGVPVAPAGWVYQVRLKPSDPWEVPSWAVVREMTEYPDPRAVQ